MKLMTKQLIAALGVTAISGTSAPAAAVIYESFDYSAGSLSTVSSSAWSGGGSVNSPGLTYGSLATAGNTAFIDGTGTGFSTGTALNGLLDDGDTLWFSVVANFGSIGTNPDFGFSLGTSAGNGTNNIPLGSGETGMGFRVKGNDGGLKAATWNNTVSTGSSTSQSLSGGTTYLIVGELIFGATDTINLYLPDTDLNLGSIVATDDVTVDQTVFNTISFQTKGATSGDSIDEIRFGTSYADVSPIPEPSSMALLGLGGLVLLRRRRK